MTDMAALSDSRIAPSRPSGHVRSGAWLAVSFGGGTNSTAMLCGLRERGLRPDVILFADTGGELPHTYEHTALMAVQTQVWWGVEIQTVFPTRKGQPITPGAEAPKDK